MERIGKYELIEKLGAGGFGTVFKARDPLLKRLVAIKTCPASDPELRERFRREAEICGRLDHPNIVRVFDCGLDGEVLFLVQEFLPGEDLEKRCARSEPLLFAEKLGCLRDVARGLEYAHLRGVVHRDIKPANIHMQTRYGAKITDFGIALLVEAEQRLTRAGLTVGTVAYLSPEQIRGEPPDARSDIFSFGVTAYELMTGQRPFQGDNISAVFLHILNDAPAPLTRGPADCPPMLSRIIHRCLRKRKEDRYRDCAALLADLEAVPVDFAVRRRGPEGVGRLPLRPPPHRSTPARNRPARSARSRTARLTPSETGIQTLPRRRAEPGRRLPNLAILLAVLTALAWWWQLDDPGLLGEMARTARGIAAALRPPSHLSAAPTPVAAEPEPASPSARSLNGPAAAGELPPVEEPEAARPPAPAIEPAVPPTGDPVASTGAIVVEPGWHRGIRLSLDDAPERVLDRTLRLTAAPGSHRLRFSLRTGAYRSFETVRVELAAGEEVTIRPPLAPPGRITVQARLGSARGTVLLDGREFRDGPIRRPVPPGRHRVRVAFPDDPATPPVGVEVSVRSGEETIVTYDASGGAAPVIRQRPIG